MVRRCSPDAIGPYRPVTSEVAGFASPAGLRATLVAARERLGGFGAVCSWCASDGRARRTDRAVGYTTALVLKTVGKPKQTRSERGCVLN